MNSTIACSTLVELAIPIRKKRKLKPVRAVFRIDIFVRGRTSHAALLPRYLAKKVERNGSRV